MKNVAIRKNEELAIDIIEIDPNRVRPEAGNVDDLVKNIAIHNLLNPITINKSEDGKYICVDGVRRLEALKKLGVKTVQCAVGEGYTAEDSIHQSYFLNKVREQLNPIEEGRFFDNVMRKYGWTYAYMKREGYGSKAYISNHVKLLGYPEDVQEKIVNGTLSKSAGIELGNLKSAKAMSEMADEAVKDGWTVGKTKRMVRNHNTLTEKGTSEPDEPNPTSPGAHFKMEEDDENTVATIISTLPTYEQMREEKGEGYSINAHIDDVEPVLQDCAKVLVPGGTLALVVQDVYGYKGKVGFNATPQMRNISYLLQAIGKKYKLGLESQIINFLPLSDEVASDGKIQNTHKTIMIFKKDGERDVSFDEIVVQSALTEEEQREFFSSVWGGMVNTEQVAERLIRMYSVPHEKVADPFFGIAIKKAHEMGREGVGYVAEEAGNEAQEAPTAESKGTLKDFHKQQLEELEQHNQLKMMEKNIARFTPEQPAEADENQEAKLKEMAIEA